MTIRKIALCFAVLFTAVISCNLHAQNQTVGLFLDTEQSFEGYTLFTPIRSTKTYLINNEGRAVKTWSAQNDKPYTAYLSEMGQLVLAETPIGNYPINAGGATGIVEKYDWEGNLLWHYVLNNATARLHHDFEVLPNGNILMIAWENKNYAEAVAEGRNPNNIAGDGFWPDYIIEVQPIGSTGANIVWEWHAWDHLIQDFDATKANYGTVSDHPELININYTAIPNQAGASDWLHSNSIAYNADMDQIILSVHNFSEVWIIDHSTSSAEAASNTGGNSGKGGDLLYRWGNSQAYNRGIVADRMLFGQHDAQWIDNALPGAGDLIVFNNGLGRPGGNYSSIDEFTPPVDAQGNYSAPNAGSAFAPSDPSWVYHAANPSSFYSQNISGTQRLANGNTLICEGQTGTFFEVTPNAETVWLYVNPVVAQGALHQDEPIPSGVAGPENNVFKIRRYAADYAGFSGYELIPGDFIELPPLNPQPAMYPIVDTNVSNCYNNLGTIAAPGAGSPYFGQDAQYTGNLPSYTDNGDDTVTDNVTGLMWQKDMGEMQTWANAVANAPLANTGAYNDWRMPTVKELFSLIYYTGQCMGDHVITKFIDTNYFNQPLGDTSNGGREIDAQTWSATEYLGITMLNDISVFGVNFVDGRVKTYPKIKPNGQALLKYARYVRGNTAYGVNDYVDNGDSTITDQASGLMWQKADDGIARDWQEALAYAENLELANHADWRLPNAKELQSIVDYSRSPQAQGGFSAAIDPIFDISMIQDPEGGDFYPYFWTGTTLLDGPSPGNSAVYVAFGRALGYLTTAGVEHLYDVHGAGAVRSDPKSGNPDDYPSHATGFQGDVQYVYNHVRCVRDVDASSGVIDDAADSYIAPGIIKSLKNYPNPFNPITTISFELKAPSVGNMELSIYNLLGQRVKTILNEPIASGKHSIVWNGTDASGNLVSSGIYFYKLSAKNTESVLRKCVLLK